MRVRKTRPEPVDLQIEDARHVGAFQFPEYDRLVEAVQQLGTERAFGFRQQLVAQDVVARLCGVFGESEGMALARKVEPEVRRADDDGVAEIDDAPLPVGETALVENLQQHVADVGVRLFEFVEENDRIRTAPHLLGELSAFVVAYISGRCADEPGGRVLLLEL